MEESRWQICMSSLAVIVPLSPLLPPSTSPAPSSSPPSQPLHRQAEGYYWQYTAPALHALCSGACRGFREAAASRCPRLEVAQTQRPCPCLDGKFACCESMAVRTLRPHGTRGAHVLDGLTEESRVQICMLRVNGGAHSSPSWQWRCVL